MSVISDKCAERKVRVSSLTYLPGLSLPSFIYLNCYCMYRWHGFWFQHGALSVGLWPRLSG